MVILKQIPNNDNKKINNDRNENEKLLGDNNNNEIKEYNKIETNINNNKSENNEIGTENIFSLSIKI